MRVYKSIMCRLLPLLMAVFLAAGCGSLSNPVQPGEAEAAETETETETEETTQGPSDTKPAQTEATDTEASYSEPAQTEVIDAIDIEASDTKPLEMEALKLPAPGLPEEFDLSTVPKYSGSIWADVNEDVPFFNENQMEAARRMTSLLSLKKGKDDAEQAAAQALTLQAYGDLDTLGRCTGACALVGPETLPKEERGNIGMIKPTGWRTVKYAGIDGNYLYNRCHLIGFQLTGQGANEKNLITGTRSMNVEGMLPYEDSVLAYVRGTGNHVLYRVAPVFEGENLLADGVLMEARSVEDPLVQFCAFCYNVQPGITIDYATGESRGPEFVGNDVPAQTDYTDPVRSASSSQTEDQAKDHAEDQSKDRTEDQNENRTEDQTKNQTVDQPAIREWKYIINVSSRKFHLPNCQSVEKMSRKNMQGFNGSREELIDLGYEPCKNCHP